MKGTPGKTEKRAGGPQTVRLLAAQRFVGVAPALSRLRHDPFCRVHLSEQTLCSAVCITT
jgi:hypothetical protein